MILFGRIVVKRLSLALFSLLYSNFNISFYSYSNMCKRLNKLQVRFTKWKDVSRVELTSL